jgi:glutaconate CoA-transferase subunit B
MDTGYTPAEIMVAAAARRIGDDDVVFVGMRLPLLSFLLAKSTHAPAAVGVFENGVIRDDPAPAPFVTMGDCPNQAGAVRCCPMIEIMGFLSRGLVTLGFIGGAEVDVRGNLNTSRVGDPSQGGVRLPGSGGGADIASMAGRFMIIMDHQRRRFVPRVSYITSPGFGDHDGWRAERGLPGGGPEALITSLGVFEFPHERAVLVSLHPGVGLDTVRAETGWDLETAPDLDETPPPTAGELEVIRRFDPQGFWTGR